MISAIVTFGIYFTTPSPHPAEADVLATSSAGGDAVNNANAVVAIHIIFFIRDLRSVL
ncbi:hypothetical protein [Bradyrhizobium ivorense]|uniref:hypothetical protein n=1 Tax=Bradyrhizobium ivorense TaxID=2511166 RepID=UPI00155A1E8F|nr:hypothetical protein [Bradyrhizobium ivorense]